MGVCNIECGITKLTIEPGEPVKIFLLLHRKFDSFFKNEGHAICNWDEITGDFYLMCLPLTATFGELTMQNIVRDTTVLRLENYFGCSFDKIWEWICQREPERIGIDKPQPPTAKLGGFIISTMFVHKAVYDGFTNRFTLDNKHSQWVRSMNVNLDLWRNWAKTNPKKADEMEDGFRVSSNMYGMASSGGFSPIGTIYDVVEDYDFLLDQWAEYGAFLIAYSRVSGRFEPSHSAPQQLFDEEQLLKTEIAYALLIERIKRYQEKDG